MTDYIGYARVSTAKQGRSGLGLEAQEAAIHAHLKEGDRLLSPLYVEVESGKVSDRPELAKALRQAKLTGATLLVAKLDRLSRNVAFISQLMEAKVDFIACDQPSATRFTLHIYAALAEQEREMISARTKAALAAAKERGKVLGGFRGYKVNPAEGTAARQARASEFKLQVAEVMAEARQNGAESLSEIARELNSRGVKTRRGGLWQAVQVQRAMKR